MRVRIVSKVPVTMANSIDTWHTIHLSKKVTPLCGCAATAFSAASGSTGGLAVRLRAARLDRRSLHCRGDALRGVGWILVCPVAGAPRSLSALGTPVCGCPRYLGFLRPHAG